MLKIRLAKTGAKNEKKFRIIVVPARSKRDGKFLEIIGLWQPGQKKEFEIDKEKYQFWLGQGAKPTKAILNLVTTNPRKKLNVKTRS